MTSVLRRCLQILLSVAVEYGRGQACLSVGFAMDAFDDVDIQPLPLPEVDGSDDAAAGSTDGVRPIAGHPERLIAHVPLSPVEQVLWAQLEQLRWPSVD